MRAWLSRWRLQDPPPDTVTFFCSGPTDNSLLCGKLSPPDIHKFKESGVDTGDELRDSGIDLVSQVLAIVGAKGKLAAVHTVSLVPVPNNDATKSRYARVAHAIADELKLKGPSGVSATVTVDEHLLTRRGDVPVAHARSRPHFGTPEEARGLVRGNSGSAWGA